MRLHIEIDKYMNIAGGQFWDHDYEYDEYTVQFEDADIEMDSATLKKMVIDAVNHLMVNGHSFEFCYTDMGQKEIR